MQAKRKHEKTRCLAVSVITLITAALFLAPAASAAGLDWKVVRTLDLEKAPLDAALSPDGRTLFVLTDEGEVLVYSSSSRTPSYRIPVGADADQIKVAQGGHMLVVGSRRDKKVRFISLTYIQDINLSGSPFKGAGDAPVAVAVFSDFQ